MSGSTWLASSTLRPVCSPMLVADAASTVLGSSSIATVISTGQELVLLLPEPVVRAADAEDHRHAVLLDQQLEEVARASSSASGDRLVEAVLLLLASRSRARRRTPAGRGLRRARRRTRRAGRGRRRACPCSCGDLEQRARVDLGDLLHAASSLRSVRRRARRSRARRAPPRRGGCWSSSVSDLRVTFSVASTVRSATSLRISWIARRVSASMSRRVCSISSSRLALARLDGLALVRPRRPCGARATISSACSRASLSRSRYSASSSSASLARALGGVDRLLDRAAGACRAPPRCAGTRASQQDAERRCRRRAASRSSARRRA